MDGVNTDAASTNELASNSGCAATALNTATFSNPTSPARTASARSRRRLQGGTDRGVLFRELHRRPRRLSHPRRIDPCRETAVDGFQTVEIATQLGQADTVGCCDADGSRRAPTVVAAFTNSRISSNMRSILTVVSNFCVFFAV